MINLDLRVITSTFDGDIKITIAVSAEDINITISTVRINCCDIPTCITVVTEAVKAPLTKLLFGSGVGSIVRKCKRQGHRKELGIASSNFLEKRSRMMMSNNSSLSLLACYGGDGDSSDDDVPGSRVSTKRMHKDDNDVRLPVPSCMKKLKTEEWLDDPSLHDGRVRTFNHERGNWPTYIYIPFGSHAGFEKLVDTLINFESRIPLKRVDDFHISLTKTVILKYHWIQSFVNTVKERTCHFKKFLVMFDDLKIYCNEERSRTFIGLQTKSGYDTLIQLVEILNQSLGEYRLPEFYEDPSFHMSIAYCVGDFEKELTESLLNFNHFVEEIVANYSDEHWHIVVDYLLCKTGNKIFQFPLT